MTSVFLSYSREDRPRAQRVVAALEEGGVSVWWDGLIEGGERFSNATEAALDGADVVVVLWSKTSVKSHWVHDEATRGRDRGRLVPASIDGSPPPLGFGQFQALDLSKWKGKAGAPEIDGLLRAIAVAVGQPQSAQPASPKTMPSPNRRSLIIGGGVTAALATGGVAAWQLGLFAPKGEANSVAVLPFRNLSGDPGQDYFAEGIAEEIRNTLARNPLLKVIATTSSNMFRERNEGVAEIATKLTVTHILDGSVRREGDMVRIALQMIVGASGRTVWSKNFDRRFAELLVMQTEIAYAAMQVLNVQLNGQGISLDPASGVLGGTKIAAAFDSFLQGKAAASILASASLIEAAAHFRRARNIDPAYAAAFSAEANVHLTSAEIVDSKQAAAKLRSQALTLALEGKRKAPQSDFTTSILGRACIDNFKFAEGLSLIKEAKRISANDFDVLMTHGRHVAYLGEFDQAEESLESAKAIDPLNLRPWLTSTWVYLWSDRPDAALKSAEYAWSLNPDFANKDWLTYFRFSGHFFAERFDEAKKAANLTNSDWEKNWQLALIDARLGKKYLGSVWLERIDAKATEIPDVTNSYVSLHAFLGNFDEAMAGLKIMLEQKDPWLVATKVDPYFAPLRKLPAFQDFVKKLGLA